MAACSVSSPAKQWVPLVSTSVFRCSLKCAERPRPFLANVTFVSFLLSVSVSFACRASIDLVLLEQEPARSARHVATEELLAEDFPLGFLGLELLKSQCSTQRGRRGVLAAHLRPRRNLSS